MNQGFHSYHWLDKDENPEGGQTSGRGFAISWQRGPLGRGESRTEPNGAFVEDIIGAARDRLWFYQHGGGGKFACEANALAIQLLTTALDVLNERTKDRETRKVEGTHAP